MFGIGGGEIIFILFIVLMLFGSDKIPEMARTMGKAMAQLKNATTDIKNEIQKGAEANGFDKNILRDLTSDIKTEITNVKSNFLENTNIYAEINETLSQEVNTMKASVISENSTSQADDLKNTLDYTDNAVVDSDKRDKESDIEDALGPIKRKK
jgi:sec-independent protein translocase protein TatA